MTCFISLARRDVLATRKTLEKKHVYMYICNRYKIILVYVYM